MAAAIAVCVLTVAVIAFRAVSQASNRYGQYTKIHLPGGALFTLYGLNGTDLQTWVAPNYGRVAQAEALRQTFYEDLSRATAVFCLARTGRDSIVRPTSIDIVDQVHYANLDARTLGTPEDFRLFLERNGVADVGFFDGYRGAAGRNNLSIFILQPSTSETTLSVRAVYELDLIATEGTPGGTYVSVRRYDNYSGQKRAPTDYYDIFYPDSDPTDFPVTAVHFELQRRLGPLDNDYDLFKVAPHSPFYFLWWPDPAAPVLAYDANPTYGGNDPRSAYGQMGSRTSFLPGGANVSRLMRRRRKSQAGSVLVYALLIAVVGSMLLAAWISLLGSR